MLVTNKRDAKRDGTTVFSLRIETYPSKRSSLISNQVSEFISRIRLFIFCRFCKFELVFGRVFLKNFVANRIDFSLEIIHLVEHSSFCVLLQSVLD